MNILISVPSLSIGGAELMVAQLIENIDSFENKVILVVLSSKQGTYIEDLLEMKGINIVYLNKKIGPNLNTILKAIIIGREFKPDIIHTHLSSFFYMLPYAIMFRIKIIHTEHTRAIFESSGFRRSILKYCYQKRIGIPVAISNLLKREISEVYNLNSDLIEIVFNPVNIKKFTNESIQKYKNNQKIVFINVARFVEPKNHLELIKAFKEVNNYNKDTKLLLLGDGPLRNVIERRINEFELENTIELKGNVQNVDYYLGTSDIFVLPSKYEGLPLTILEAMAAGLPIIATSVGGVPDIVKDNGVLVDPGNHERLVSTMIELANNKKLRLKMGELSIKEVQKYDISKVTIKYEELYKKYAKY